MIIIAFIHGIGNFHPNDKDKILLFDMLQLQARQLFDGKNVTVLPLAYEDLLERRPISFGVNMAASVASKMYLGTPVIGNMLTDYGTDILAYYLEPSVRADVTRHVSYRLYQEIKRQELLRTWMPDPIEQIIIVGHSLGSLVMFRLANMLQRLQTAPGEIVLLEDGPEENPGKLVTISNRLMEEMKVAGRIETLGLIAQHKIKYVAMGSPAFSARLKGVRAATRSLALAESPATRVAQNQVNMGKAPIINVHSLGTFWKDPLAGPAPEPFVNVAADHVSHINLEGHFRALFEDQEAQDLLLL